MRNISYKNDRQYARSCADFEYEQHKIYEMKYNPLSNELYGKDYNCLRDDQKRYIIKHFQLRRY